MTATVMTSIGAPPKARGGHPIFGQLPAIERDGVRFLTNLHSNYGDVVIYRLGPLKIHMIMHPDDVQRVLQERYKLYTKRLPTYKMVYPLVGRGMLTSDGEFWLRQRRLAQPAFHRQRIAGMGQMMVDATAELFERWDAAAAAGTPLDIAEEMMGLTLTIVGRALFGTDLRDKVATIGTAFTELNGQLSQRARSFRSLVPPVLPTARDRAYRHALSTLNTVVAEIIAERRRSPGGDDLLSMLMAAEDEDDGARMSDQQLRDEVMTLLLAGHETTATALAWSWALLDQHPAELGRMHAEIDALAGRTPSIADLPSLPYARMVFDETLRLYPPVFLISRRAEEEDVLGGYRIPKGALVAMSPYITQRRPDFWERPDDFIPERFSPERAAGRHKFAYFPFIGGPRQCIGNSFAQMEGQIILAMLGQRYRLRVAPGHTVAPDPQLTLRPAGGLPMIIERR